MLVTTDVSRADAPERDFDSAPYAYAAPTASSFIAILNELKPRNLESEPRREVNADSAMAKSPIQSSTEAGANAETEAPEEVTAKSPTTDTDAQSDENANVAADGDASLESSERSDGDPAVDALSAESDANVVETIKTPEPAPAGGAPVVAAPAQVGEPETASALPAAVLRAGQDAEGSATNATEIEAAPALADGETETDDGKPAPLPFPKTLNALLAERAVRAMERSTATEVTPSQIAVSEEIKASGPAEDNPAPPAPAARAAAMELGGVRSDSVAMPRIPLTNLPGELAQQIHMMQQDGLKTMRIRLVPENLGELHIEIRGTGENLRVKMISASPAVRDALDSQIGELRQALQKQGLHLDHVLVDSETSREGAARRREQPRYEAKSGGPAEQTGPAIETTATAMRDRPDRLAGALNLLA